MYGIVVTSRAKKSIKKRNRSGVFDGKALTNLLTLLESDTVLPAHYKDHQLKGSLHEYRECHLAFDLLVRYKRNEQLKTVTISEIGTHDELFG
jgi:mRNA interferase YafQ